MDSNEHFNVYNILNNLSSKIGEKFHNFESELTKFEEDISKSIFEFIEIMIFLPDFRR